MIAKKNGFIVCILLIAGVISACNDKNLVVDTNREIVKHNWSYIDKVKIPVTISNTAKFYNIYLNLRHSGDYKYSNIFILVHQISPKGKVKTERKEIKLANPDGEWLGKGSGNIYSCQILFQKQIKFSDMGKYQFELEQNMRDNPLREVIDAGLRVEFAD
jgi:gliding motility-associated lipoprotein GldH